MLQLELNLEIICLQRICRMLRDQKCLGLCLTFWERRKDATSRCPIAYIASNALRVHKHSQEVQLYLGQSHSCLCCIELDCCASCTQDSTCYGTCTFACQTSRAVPMLSFACLSADCSIFLGFLELALWRLQHNIADLAGKAQG